MVAKICSVNRQYADDYTLEGSLSKNGYNRFPGTGVRLVPFKEANGTFRTGLDPEAVYIQKMSPAEREIEKTRVTQLKLELERLSQMDLGSTADYYTKMYDGSFGENGRARVVKLMDGSNIFNLKDVFDSITFAWLRVHPQIAPSHEAYKSGKFGNVQYYVSDPQVEDEIKFKEKSLVNKAVKELEELSPKKRKTVCRLLGLPVSDDSTESHVYNLLDTYLKDVTVKSGEFKGQQAVRLFLDIVSMKEDNLQIKDLVKQSLEHGIYRYKAGKIWEGGIEIAKTEKDLVDHLLTPKYQDDLLALEEKLKSKKSILQ